MKTCSRCKEEKPLDQFNRDRMVTDGRQRYCKACMKAYNRTPKRKVVRARYKASDNGMESEARYRRGRRRRYPEKIRAKNAANQAVRDGKLPPVTTQTCAGCGTHAENYHHPDYKHPLAVMALCGPCHREVHANV